MLLVDLGATPLETDISGNTRDHPAAAALAEALALELALRRLALAPPARRRPRQRNVLHPLAEVRVAHSADRLIALVGGGSGVLFRALHAQLLGLPCLSYLARRALFCSRAVPFAPRCVLFRMEGTARELGR